MIAEALTAVLVLLGAAFTLIGSIGLARLPDFFTRLHGPTKATTLGVGGIVLASIASTGSLRALAVALFLFVTAPITAHVLAKTAKISREDPR